MTVTSFFKAVGDFFLPQICLFCGKEGRAGGRYPVCETCVAEFLPLGGPRCPSCGKPLLAGSDSHLCGECLRDPPIFERAWSLFPYEGKVRHLIHLFKFRGDLAAVSVIRFLLEEIVSLPEVDADVVVPVPMDPQALKNRGYNQALMIATLLARLRKIPVDRFHLIKSRKTLPQVGLTKSERKRNVQGAFSVTKREVFIGKKVLLVDDVFTTGATIQACSRALKRGGASRIDVLTLARVVSG